jgi:hypothetical protein
MEPMKPMKPMAPMKGGEKWWPDDLGAPSSTGSQDDVRYAFFPKKRRLVVERSRHLTTYDSGAYDINGVSQAGSHSTGLIFTSTSGPVELEKLQKLG